MTTQRESGPFSLAQNPAHLGLGSTTVVEPDFTGDMQWYADYTARHASDGLEARLVALHHFSQPWDTWEMHPNGSELVLVTSGQVTLLQEHAGGVASLLVSAGEYIVNPPGVWHTMDVAEPATALFITAGVGTQIRPR